MVGGLDAKAADDVARQHAETRGELGYTAARDNSHDELRVVASDRLLGLDRHGAVTLPRSSSSATGSSSCAPSSHRWSGRRRR